MKLINQNKKQSKFAGLTLLLCALGFSTQPVHAEGSRTLYPAGTTGSRANLEWRTSTYGGSTNSLKRRTLLQVYAQKDEYILLGSSAVGVENGDISVYQSNKVSGRIGAENISGTADFKCSTQRASTTNTNQGKITSRKQELAGPDTITNETNATAGGQVTDGYVPCYYKVPASGIYYVVFYGTSGDNNDTGATVGADVNLTNPDNFNNKQATSVAAWDVTVRSNLTSTIDIKGRLFADYLALFTGDNNRPLNSSFYIATRDGYKYRTDFNGLDPNGFVIYGNDVGYYNSDGQTPLYHNVLGSDGNLSLLEGGTSLALPTHLVFFSNPFTNATQADQAILARGYLTVPTPPQIIKGSSSFTGTAGGNTSNINTGGTFKFDSATPGSYEILISRDGTNFDPSVSQNRVIRGLMASSGTQTVIWDGKDNSGTPFPSGINYQAQIRVRNGEYHFPLIDAENSLRGGPSFTLLNATNPKGQTVGYYDDRGYRTLSGATVGTPGSVLCGIKPPTTNHSNYLNGFDTTSTQRAFGDGNPSSNKNTSCTGSFGDAKGLDIWTYIASQEEITAFNIVASPINANKTVALVGDNDKSNSITPSDTIEYTIVVTNITTNLTAPNVVLKDSIPANTVYVADSLQISAGDNNGAKTDASDSDQAEFSSSQAIFRLGSGANGTTGGSMAPGTTTTIKFHVKINDPLPAGVSTVSNQAVVSSNGYADVKSNDPSTPTPEDPSVTKIGPRLRLVKRVTGIRKDGSTTTTAIGGYNNLDTDDNDNAAAWSFAGGSNAYLLGAINSEQIPSPNPGVPLLKDEVEYTIYFLSDGAMAAQDVNICDFIPEYQTYVDNSMTLKLSNGAETTVPDGSGTGPGSDHYKKTNTTFPPTCKGTNNDGAVYIKIGDLNVNSFGLIRFRAKIK